MSKGLVRCLCGLPAAVICAHCARNCCREHHAYTPTGGQLLDPACFPRCDSPWWATAALEYYAARYAADEEEEATTLLHAGRLLRRGADVEAVAAELGLSESMVRDIARRLG